MPHGLCSSTKTMLTPFLNSDWVSLPSGANQHAQWHPEPLLCVSRDFPRLKSLDILHIREVATYCFKAIFVQVQQWLVEELVSLL